MRSGIHAAVMLMILWAALCGTLVRADEGSPESPVWASLSAGRAEAVLGETVTWQLVVANGLAVDLDDVNVYSQEPEWQWSPGSRTLGKIAAGSRQVISLEAMPLRLGELRPMLIVSYDTGQETHHLEVRADQPLRVVPIRDVIQAELVLQKASLNFGEAVGAEIWVTNRSPFDIHCGAPRADGAAMTIAKYPPYWTVQANSTAIVNGMIAMENENVAPGLVFNYTWAAPAPKRCDELMRVAASGVQVRPGFWRAMRDALTDVVLLLATALVGLVGWAMKSAFEHRLVERLHRERVLGMLQHLPDEAGQAASEGTPMDVASLRQLLGDKDLYVALNQLDGVPSLHAVLRPFEWVGAKARDLWDRIRKTKRPDSYVEVALNLWRAAEQHNLGLQHPWGSARADALRARGEALTELLKQRGQRKRRGER